MFTGIIQAKAKVLKSSEKDGLTTLVIFKPTEWNVIMGQSIAINGACLTVTAFDDHSFTVQMMQETMKKTSFGTAIPEEVNLERSVTTTSLFDGHIVQGHVDAVGTVKEVKEAYDSTTISITYPKSHAKLTVDKGSITVDGVSLTIIDAGVGVFSIGLIPHTLAITTLSSLEKGSKVNLEFDIIGKYVQRMKSS